MGKHVEAIGNSYGQDPTGAWADISEIVFKPLPTGSGGDEPTNSHEGYGSPGQRGLLTLRDLMPRRDIKAVVANPITLDTCWKAARRYERSKSTLELISATVAYANLGTYAHNPETAKAYLTRALHLADKIEGKADQDVLIAIRIAVLDSLAQVEASMGNPERSAACRRSAASLRAACSPRHEARIATVNPSVVGGRRYDANGNPLGPYAPAA